MRAADEIIRDLHGGGLSPCQALLLTELVLVLSTGHSGGLPVESPDVTAANRRRDWDKARKRRERMPGGKSAGNVKSRLNIEDKEEALQPKEVEKKKESKSNKSARGTRCPPDAQLSEAGRQSAIAAGLRNIDRHWSEFVDYWQTVPGARGLKLDWAAAWRVRIGQILTYEASRDNRNNHSRANTAAGRATASESVLLTGLAKGALGYLEKGASAGRDREISGSADAPKLRVVD